MTPFLAGLARRQLLVVTGKGGVGKSAVSASLGRLLAEAGRRVAVVEVDPRENVHQMLGIAPSGGQIVAAGHGLWVQNLKPRQVVDEIVRERLKVGLLVDRVLRSPIYEPFATGAPGLRELAILGHALRLVRGLTPGAPALDLVILDAPATGHGVRLLKAPQLVAEVIDSGPFGTMAGELAAWIADAERVGIVVVTLAEEMPVDEALELRQALAGEVGREVEALVVNGLYPAVPAGAPDDAVTALWRRRRRGQEAELARLADRWPGPRFSLPQLALDRGPALARSLGEILAAPPEGG
jgi:anion-transporting  ArsA/GET3 family ATPase